MSNPVRHYTVQVTDRNSQSSKTVELDATSEVEVPNAARREAGMGPLDPIRVLSSQRVDRDAPDVRDYPARLNDRQLPKNVRATSADQALGTARQQLGPDAEVLSSRLVPEAVLAAELVQAGGAPDVQVAAKQLGFSVSQVAERDDRRADVTVPAHWRFEDGSVTDLAGSKGHQFSDAIYSEAISARHGDMEPASADQEIGFRP